VTSDGEPLESRRPRASIATKRGDAGETRLVDGSNLSKADARVEAYGAIDELNAVLGVARASCDEVQIVRDVREIQRDLFAIGAAISTKAGSPDVPLIGRDMVERLDALVARYEAEPGVAGDWTLPGEYRGSAAFEVARTVCRRAERATVRYVTSGGRLQPNLLAYLNRLSDVIWLCARVIEARAGVDARLRDERHPGPPWSRAW